MERSYSPIFREIKRNTFVDKVVPDLTGYYCVTAHDMSCERHAKLRKLARFSHVRQSVIERIMHGWAYPKRKSPKRSNGCPTIVAPLSNGCTTPDFPRWTAASKNCVSRSSVADVGASRQPLRTFEIAARPGISGL